MSDLLCVRINGVPLYVQSKSRRSLAGGEKTLETFSIRFFMENPQTAKYHVTTALRSGLQFVVHV